MRHKTKVLIVCNLLLFMFFFNRSLMKKEKTLASGKLVLLELAPVDPRSLMQGDYMRLRYAIAQDSAVTGDMASRGYAVIKLNEHGVAQLLRFQQDSQPLHAQEMLIRYTYIHHNLYLGAESYFFEEGQANTFAQAKYGGVKVDEKGNSILTGLYNEDYALINPIP